MRLGVAMNRVSTLSGVVLGLGFLFFMFKGVFGVDAELVGKAADSEKRSPISAVK